MALPARWFLAHVTHAGLVIAVIAAVPSASLAQPIAASTLKAAFMLNFVKFTQWPARDPESSILVCVFGDEEVADAMTRTVRGQSVANRSVRVARIAPDDAVRDCHVLFVAGREAGRLASILEDASRFPVLTISDIEQSAMHGAMIELFMDSGRLRFAVNVDTMERSGIRLSSQVLALAKIVQDTP